MINFRHMRRLIRKEEKLRWDIMRLNSKATKATASISAAGGGSTYRVGSKVEEGAIALTAIKDTYRDVSEELIQNRNELRRAMGKLDNKKFQIEKMCLRMRYLEGISIRVISTSLNYSESYIYTIMCRAETLICKAQNRIQKSNLE